jgi:AcrR family transcriptional regulator
MLSDHGGSRYPGAVPSASFSARQIARDQLSRTIVEAAREELALHGAAALSLRAVARRLGVVSSALYRYFASRDELFTELIVEAYDAVGIVAEAADAAARAAAAEDQDRVLAVGRAVRAWAVDRPQEFALIFGSPIPGYQAPEATVAPAARVPLVLAAIVTDALRSGRLRIPGPPVVPRTLTTPDVQRAVVGAVPDDHPDLVERAVVLWTVLVGSIAFELFGHLHQVVTDYPAYFDAALRIAAQGVGIDPA